MASPRKKTRSTPQKRAQKDDGARPLTVQDALDVMDETGYALGVAISNATHFRPLTISGSQGR